jgi:hypothetical protein
MDELQKLYDLLVREGKYTKSFDEFKVKWGSEQGYQDKVFDVVSRDGFYTKDKGTFMSKYGMPQEVKKKEGVVLPPSPSPNATELPLGIGSLEYAKPTKPVEEGPTEKLAVGPIGVTGLERTKEYVPAKEQGKQGTILNTVSSLDKGFYKNLIGSPVKGLGTLLEGVTGKGFVSDALIKFGNYFNKTIDELTPQDEEFKNSLTDQFGQAFGQVASLVATGGATGALSKGATAAGAAEAALAAQAAPEAVGAISALKTLGSELASPTAVSAGLAMGQGEFERAKAAGATDEQAFEAFYKNAAVGSVLEKIPVMQFLKRFEKASAGGISNYIKTKGVSGIVGGIEEMTTEVLQGIYANLTAQDIYDANQKMFDGIGEAGGVGFGVGFLLNAMGANVKILRSEGREEEAQVVENQIAQFESQAAKGGVSSYKISGVSVKSPEIINKMIDNMDATDLVRANIEIENDPELNTKLQDKIVTSSIKEQVRQGNPDLNETSLDAITKLELELRKLEGNTTQTGKDKAAAIRSQIKNIQENQLTKKVDNSSRIAELEGILSSADSNLAETGFTSLSQDARVEIEKELQDLKTKQDVQKQTAGQVPLQSGAEGSGEVAQGEPQAGPQVATKEGVQAEVVQEEVVPAEGTEEISTQLNDLVSDFNTAYSQPSAPQTTAEKRTATAKANKAIKRLNDFFGFAFGSRANQEQANKQDALTNIKSLLDQDSPLGQFANVTELMNAYNSDKQNNVESQLVKDVDTIFGITPTVSLKTQEVAPVAEAVLEVEQYEPITESQVSHEKKFNKNTATDYEEDTRETDSGREVTYLSRVTVEALDDNTGDAIGGLVKIVDEDKNVSWQAVDVDGNELGKQDFDSLEEAKTALVKNWNKVQKKEFDKEAKRKAKEAAKKAKKTYETLPTKRVQPESGVVQPKTKAETKPTGLAVPSKPSTKREEVKGSIQRIANAGLLRSAETGKPAITEQEIDVQMALTDAMASVWEETTGKNNFYETFISDVKEGDVEAIKQKGGALFQNTEVPQRPISRVTLGVFEEPLFQNMKGAMVAPQSISDFMKSKGKQIEKEIINNVLSYDKYKGQKRISFDEFRDDVETQIMKLERIDSKSYSDYGMDNLGDNHNYGKDQTIIFNSPIDHGQYGHFRGDFTKGQLNDVTWEVRQIPNTEQYVAIDADMPPGTPSNQIAQYVGTAGSIEEVNKWVSDRTSASLDAQINKGLFGHIRNWFNQNTGVYTLAELQSDYFQKNKANDLYASKISQDEVNEYVNKNFRRKLDNETTEAIKKEFGIVVEYAINVNGDTIANATVKGFPNIPDDYPLSQGSYSESFVPAPGFTLEDVMENRTVVEALRILATKDTDVAARRREIVNEYEAKRLALKAEENKYIAKRIEEIKKSEPASLMMSQFIASQKVHELRLFRESLKHAADKGATELWFPTPYTIAVIEGYVSSTGNAPYEVINGDESQLSPGDTINYGGTEMTVVESSGFSITVAPSDNVYTYDIDSLRYDETNGRMDELEYDLRRQVGNINTITREQVEEYDTDLFLSEQVQTSFIKWFDENPEEEYATWSEIEDEVRDYVADYYYDTSVEDLVSWASEVYMEGNTVFAIENRRSTERLGQPSEYESNVDEDDFEGDLSEEQYTVVKKYEELGKMIRKMRPDAEVVTDNNGKRWLKTAITKADASNPIIAFQEEGGKIKGAVDFSNDNKASIYIFDGADISTLAHEMSGHIGRRFLEQLSMVNEKFASDYEYAKKWAGVKDNQWSRAAEEKWARGFEKYLRTGKAPNAKLKDVFEKLRTWLTNIYKTIKGSSIDIKLTPEIIRVFDNLLTTKTAEKKPASKVQVEEEEAGPTAEDLSSIEAMLDLDMDNEDNMLSVLNALDKVDNAITKRLRGGANDALLALPLSTVQLVVKTLKALVKGGMMLRDAIKKVATDNNISQQLVKDVLNISEIQDGFNELMDKVGAMIDRQTRRGTPEARMISNIDTLVRNSEVYQNATDSQKKILEREARARAGAPARRAPSIGRILGVLKDITNVSREDKLKIISQIRQLSKDAAKDLANEIRDLAKTGKITVNQAANIVARFGKVNMLSEISVSKFVDYMTKVFNDAEYNSKLSSAKSTKRDIAKLSKNKDKDANLRDLGQEFIKIDPSMVKDIDEYNEMASKIKEAIKGSTIRGQKVSFASTVNVQDASAYIKDTLDAQDKMMRAEKAAEIQSLMGIDVSEFSYDDMMMLLESDKPITKYNEGIIRDTINRAFGIYSSIIKDAMRTGKDPFTGEDVKFTESQKDVVDRFMKMDLNILKPKEALQAVDALANFLQNQSTARMESVVSKYTGLAGAKEINSKGIKAFPLKKYWSRTIGRILGEQTTNINVLFERMFKGFNKGGMVMDKMGLTKLINKKAAAEKEANNIVDRFVNLFYDKKANGEDFNSAYNNIERGMASFMMRNVIGTEQEMKAEFDRRKGLLEESISVLEKGNDKEKAKAELYKKAYDNILADSNTIEEVKNKVDKVNLEGVDFWMNEWSNKYDQLSDVAENVYNKKLDKDINYTPDRYFKLSSDTGTVEITEDDSAFLVNSGVNNLYQRETGVLMTATRPESLPVSPESGDVNRYIDLSFDNNNANSMYDALVDINTAAPIRQIQAFLNSSDYKKIVPTSEDAKILKDRIQLYVRNIRDKNPYSNDELSSVVRKLNKIAAIGVGQALGGVTQPLKQVIPVMLNTLVNTKGSLNLSATFNKAKNDFINKSGYAIANRGIESQAQVESLNRLMEEVSKSKGDKLIKKIEELNKWWLDKFLVKPDVFIARASWLSYYEKYLKDNGLYGTTVETKTPSGEIEVTTPGIDYNTHKLNEDAANYAQRMVDRQQNVSDTDLAGKLFADRGSANQLLVKTLMPFASFRMNQSARLGADLATLTNKTSSKEDKAVAKLSLAGFAVESATFRLVSIGISILLGSLAKAIMGIDEDDEEYEKRVDNIIKGGKTGMFTDAFSPVPIADKLVQAGGALITQSIEDATGLPTAIYSPRKEEFLQNAGLFGIAADRAAQLYEITKLSVTGEYTDDFGKEKTISSDAQDGLKMLIVPALMTNTGLAPSEVNSIVRYAIKDSKKSRKTSQEKAEKAERKQDTEEKKQQKLEAFENIKAETSDPEVLDAVQEKIKELKATAEQKTAIEKKNKAERSLKKSLLVDPATGEEYDTETELKRYNKDLWEQNFGENSEWFRQHEAEKEAEKLLNKEIRRMEDEEYDYTAPKRKKRTRNSDGTFKRKSSGFGSAKFGGG